MNNEDRRLKNLIKWKPGQSGNPNGRPRTQQIPTIEEFEKEIKLKYPDFNIELSLTKNSPVRKDAIYRLWRDAIYDLSKTGSTSAKAIVDSSNTERLIEDRPSMERLWNGLNWIESIVNCDTKTTLQNTSPQDIVEVTETKEIVKLPSPGEIE